MEASHALQESSFIRRNLINPIENSSIGSSAKSVVQKVSNAFTAVIKAIFETLSSVFSAAKEWVIPKATVVDAKKLQVAVEKKEAENEKKAKTEENKKSKENSAQVEIEKKVVKNDNNIVEIEKKTVEKKEVEKVAENSEKKKLDSKKMINVGKNLKRKIRSKHAKKVESNINKSEPNKPAQPVKPLVAEENVAEQENASSWTPSTLKTIGLVATASGMFPAVFFFGALAAVPVLAMGSSLAALKYVYDYRVEANVEAARKADEKLVNDRVSSLEKELKLLRMANVALQSIASNDSENRFHSNTKKINFIHERLVNLKTGFEKGKSGKKLVANDDQLVAEAKKLEAEAQANDKRRAEEIAKKEEADRQEKIQLALAKSGVVPAVAGGPPVGGPVGVGGPAVAAVYVPPPAQWSRLGWAASGLYNIGARRFGFEQYV